MEKKLKRIIVLLSIVIFLLLIVIGLLLYFKCIEDDQEINDSTKNITAIVEETYIKENEFGHRDIANFNIKKVLSDELDITNEVDIDWLHDAIQNSEVTGIPSPRIGLILDVKLVFDDNTSAQLELLSEEVYCIIYNNEYYCLVNAEIAEWLSSLS